VKFEIAGHCQLTSRDAFKEKPGHKYNLLRLIKERLGIQNARKTDKNANDQTRMHRHELMEGNEFIL
jgi:hypothetical protein